MSTCTPNNKYFSIIPTCVRSIFGVRRSRAVERPRGVQNDVVFRNKNFRGKGGVNFSNAIK